MAIGMQSLLICHNVFFALLCFIVFLQNCFEKVLAMWNPAFTASLSKVLISKSIFCLHLKNKDNFDTALKKKGDLAMWDKTSHNQWVWMSRDIYAVVEELYLFAPTSAFPCSSFIECKEGQNKVIALRWVTAVIHYLVPQRLNYFTEAQNLLQSINSHNMEKHDGYDLYGLFQPMFQLPVLPLPAEQYRLFPWHTASRSAALNRSGHEGKTHWSLWDLWRQLRVIRESSHSSQYNHSTHCRRPEVVGQGFCVNGPQPGAVGVKCTLML